MDNDILNVNQNDLEEYKKIMKDSRNSVKIYREIIKIFKSFKLWLNSEKRKKALSDIEDKKSKEVRQQIKDL